MASTLIVHYAERASCLRSFDPTSNEEGDRLALHCPNDLQHIDMTGCQNAMCVRNKDVGSFQARTVPAYQPDSRLVAML